MNKPITLARRDYINSLVNLTNNSGLPAFVVVDVLENILRELRPMIDTELKRDEALYRAELQKETENNDKE